MPRAPLRPAGHELMRIGLFDGGQRGRAVATLNELVERACRAERLGLASVWLSNIVGHDAMTVAAVAARATTRLALGTAVVPTYPRHPHAMAQQAASTQAAAGGRFALGIGPSHRVVVEGRWGLSYDHAYAHTREYLTVLTALLRTGTVDHTGELFSVHAPLTSSDGLPVPVLISALGPKMLALAGSVADGTVTWMVGPRTLRDHIVPRVREAAARAGRPEPRIVVGLPLSVTADVAAAREVAARTYSRYSSLPAYRAMLDREGVEGPAEVAIVGDRRHVTDRLAELGDAGATEVIAQPFTPEDEAGIDEWMSILAEAAAVPAPQGRT